MSERFYLWEELQAAAIMHRWSGNMSTDPDGTERAIAEFMKLADAIRDKWLEALTRKVK